MMKRTRFSIAAFLSGSMLLWLAPSATAQPIDVLCQGKNEGKVSDASVSRKYEQGVGFNPAQYITKTYSSPAWPRAGNPAELAKQRERFRTDRLKSFITEHGMAVLDVPAVLALLDRPDAWTAIQKANTALSSVVRVYEERAETDCRTGAYSYSVQFLMPKNPLQILPYPLRTALQEAVDQAVSQAFNGRSLKDGLTFRVDEIVEKIRKTLAGNERVGSESNRPDSALRLLHPRFRELFPQEANRSAQASDAFGIGEYRLSPEMAHVIEQILRRFLRRPEIEKDSFNLVVRGYADAKPVREIPYAGSCDINGGVSDITEFTTPKNAAPASTITSNSQLSIARGCEGARFAKTLIPASRHIRVFYSGVSAIKGASEDAYRGIELRLERTSS